MRLPLVAVALAVSVLSPTPSLAFEVIIRTFIPKEHPSKPGYMLPVPGKPGKTMLPEAPVGQCFSTDNRDFSTDTSASSRFGGKLVIDPSTLHVTSYEITGTTTEYTCSSGSVLCSAPSGSGGFELVSQDVVNDKLTIRYAGEASNPCLTLAPDIEFSGSVMVDPTAKTVSMQGTVDCFPSFEAILVKSDGTRTYLYRTDPRNGETPACLLTSSAGGSRAVSSGPVPF